MAVVVVGGGFRCGVNRRSARLDPQLSTVRHAEAGRRLHMAHTLAMRQTASQSVWLAAQRRPLQAHHNNQPHAATAQRRTVARSLGHSTSRLAARCRFFHKAHTRHTQGPALSLSPSLSLPLSSVRQARSRPASRTRAADDKDEESEDDGAHGVRVLLLALRRSHASTRDTRRTGGKERAKGEGCVSASRRPWKTRHGRRRAARIPGCRSSIPKQRACGPRSAARRSAGAPHGQGQNTTRNAAEGGSVSHRSHCLTRVGGTMPRFSMLVACCCAFRFIAWVLG